MKDLVLDKITKRWEEVMKLPPQTLGPFTPLYKVITKRLKIMPFIPLVLLSIVVVLGIYVLVGSAITFVVSILQRGF